jgi:hypothetical protein
MPDLRFVVFAARRKPLPPSWSRAAQAGGHGTFLRSEAHQLRLLRRIGPGCSDGVVVWRTREARRLP